MSYASVSSCRESVWKDRALLVCLSCSQPVLDIGQVCADAILVTLLGGQIDGVSEVSGQHLVRFCF